MKVIGYAFVVGDLFHVGHLQFLETAKKRSDYLIVGVLDDKAVKSYKRSPIIPLPERMRIVGALKCVDRVVIQPSRDPTETMKKLGCNGVRISFLFHGDDWETVPGTEYIESIGGRLVKPPYYKEQTTTKIIEKIKRMKE